MSRNKIFNEDSALDSAMRLFWKKGYEASSMQALEDVMGLKRSSIYNAFGNKRSLFKLTVERYSQLVLSNFLSVINEAETANEAIRNVLHEVIALHFNKDNPGGCMVVLSLMESQQHDKDTLHMLQAALNMLHLTLVKRFEKAVDEGDMDMYLNCEAMASEVTALITGMIVMAKSNFSKSSLESLVGNFLATKG